MSSEGFDVEEITGEWDREHDHKTPADFGTPVEMRFVLDVRDNPEDSAMRMVYADWLEQEGQTDRAELVRLLADQPPERTPERTRLRVLGFHEKREWLAVIGRGPIEGCEPTFRFKCPLRWEALAGTDAPDVRHCDQCNRQVHFCTDLGDVKRNARAGNCVAFSAMLLHDEARGLYADGGEDIMMGDISPPEDWESSPPTPR